jgi:acyl-CoA synthetase (NDP forming)
MIIRLRGGFVTFENTTNGFVNLDRLFAPASIAVVGVSTAGAGASTEKVGFGAGILRSLLAFGYDGKLYPVNNRGGSFEGMTVFSSVEAIPCFVDFAIIAVPADQVPSTVEACRKKGAVGAEVLSAGFKETGTPEGIALEKELQKVARRGIRVIGPNCFGIYCPKSGLTILPGPDLSREPGGVAFLSQSGGLSVDFAYTGQWRGIRFSKVVSFGNGCDLRETEMLDYLRRDPETKVVCMYVEGVTDGRKFFSVLKETVRQKPVIVVKGGLSDSGSRAVASHTASLGGQRVIWEAILRQCHAIQVDDLTEMSDAALAFSILPAREYRGCCVAGAGGALAIAAADAAETFGLTVPRLREELQSVILDILPKPGSCAVNPIDLANPFVTPRVIREILLRAAQDENVDILILVQLFHYYKAQQHVMGAASIRKFIPVQLLVTVCREVMEIGKKPVVLVLPDSRQEEDSIELESVIREARRIFIESGMAVFTDMKNALRAIALVSRYSKRRAEQPLLKIRERPSFQSALTP